MTNSNDDHKLLLENNRMGVGSFKYLLGALLNKPTQDSFDYIQNETDKILELRKSGESVVIDSTVVFVQTLIDKIAELVTAYIETSVSISREYVPKADSADVYIKLHGDDSIESYTFSIAMKSIADYDKVRAVVYRIFTTTHNSNNAIHNLLRIMSFEDAHGKSDEKLKNDPFIWFQAAMSMDDVTKKVVKSVFITSVIKSLLCSALPELLTAIKAYKSHVDLVVVSSDKHDISFNGQSHQSTQYYHVYYEGVGYNNISGSGTMSVKSDGMFSKDKLQAILAQKQCLSKATVVSWQEIKDEQSYNTFNS